MIVGRVFCKLITTPLDFVWEFIREWNRMKLNDHKGMEWLWNGIYLCKEKEWKRNKQNGIK